MKYNIVRSVSIDHSQSMCQKLRHRSNLRSITPDIRAAHFIEKPSSPKLEKKESLQYDAKTRIANMPLIGEIHLAREEFHLVSPNEKKARVLKPDYQEVKTKSPFILNSFIKESKNLFSSRKNYFSSLKKSLKDLKSLNIAESDMEDLVKVIHSRPFHDPKSKTFLKAVKTGDLVAVRKLLKENQYIVQSFDSVGLTALHWCAIRGRIDVAVVLLNSHALIDAIDMVNRTPLLVAVKRENFEFIKFLLINKANPMIVPDSRKKLFDYSRKYVVQEFLKKGIMLFQQFLKLPNDQREERWKNEFAPRFHNFDSIKPRDLQFVKMKSGNGSFIKKSLGDV